MIYDRLHFPSYCVLHIKNTVGTFQLVLELMSKVTNTLDF